MSVTYNRRPGGVSVPSSSDVKQYYFNHYTWKGINQNSNFLAVDQETFADAKNVYVDDAGLLKSRLPLKFRSRIENKDLKDVEVFDNILICTYMGNDGEWYIGIIEDEAWIIDYKVFADYPLKAFRNGNYVYVFTNQGIISYDSETKSVDFADLYIPVTRVYVGSNFDNFDESNVLTNSEKYRYILYPSVSSDYDPTDKNYYVSNGISLNAYGKTGTYSHYVNDRKVTHNVKIDENGLFKSIIHQPLSHDASGFYTTNRYGIPICTAFIFNNFIYKFLDGKLYRATASDGIFDIVYKDDKFSFDDFVKLRVIDDMLYFIYSNGIRTFDLVTEETSYVTKTNLIDAYPVSESFNTISIYNQTLTYAFYEGEFLRRMKLSSVNANTWSGKISSEMCYFSDESGSHICHGISLSASNTAGNAIFNDIILYNAYDTSTYDPFYSFFGEINWPDDTGFDLEYTSDSLPAVPKNFVQNNIYIDLNRLNNAEFYAILGYAETREDRVLYGKIIFNEDYIDANLIGYLPHDKVYEAYYLNGNYYEYSDYALTVNNQTVTDNVAKFVAQNFSDYWFYVFNGENVVLSNYRINSTNIDVLIEAEPTIIVPTAFAFLNNKLFIGRDNRLDIGQVITDLDDEKKKLYVRESDYRLLDETINGFHKISDSEIGIFCNNSTWYNTLSDGVYYYNSSKIVPTLKNKSELITLPDSTTTLMPSRNGIIALSYQNFVNTTEQSTVNLTQDISSIYSKFSNNIRSLNWKSYTLFYERDNTIILIYDNRFGAWWQWELPVELTKLFIYNDKLYLLSEGCIYEFSSSTNNYFDLINTTRKPIDWFIESQMLHLNANNYYKHISNLTLSSVEESDIPISLNLNVKNYRKWVDNGKAENFDYHIDVIRTYIKRVNYAKVCEFQYKLSSDNEAAINAPLALSGVVIKYKIGGQVR